MRRKQLLLVIFAFLSLSVFGQYQKAVGINFQHYHDLNIELIKDGSNDYVVASNLFDPPMANEELSLKRIDSNGNIVWIQKYNINGLTHARAFDVVSVADTLFVTGSVDVVSIKKVFLAKILVSNGTLLASNYYDILSPNLNSRGLHVIYSAADTNGDGAADQGLVVSGFFSDCYAVNTVCTNNFGFVMRTDLNLNVIWTIEIDTPVPGPEDYDFANHVTETVDGYFITGSATAATNPIQQGVLAHKVDFLGNQVWDGSYWFGNSRDVSVDAYFDVVSLEILMLANYSSSHYFAITCFNNATGVVNLAKSWYANDPDLNRYGFSLFESSANQNHLIISGYDRDENWQDISANNLYGESNLFVYEFDKSNGTPAGPHHQYLVPHVEPSGDEFNFWSAQMPLIYYPDISFQNSSLPGAIADYYHVGYRTEATSNLTETELFKTDNTQRNDCDFLNFAPIPSVPVLNSVQASSGHISTNTIPFQMTVFVLAHHETPCDLFTGIDEYFEDKEIIVYPNPTSESFNLFLDPSITGEISIDFTDITGKLVERVIYNPMQENSIYTINTAILSKGIYILHVEVEGHSWYDKVIVQ